MSELKQMRLYYGLTLEDIAKATGYTVSYITRYEQGKYKKSKCDAVYNVDTLEKLRREKYADLLPIMYAKHFKKEAQGL